MGLALILLPGLLCDARAWAYQSQHLRDMADIIVPDLSHATSPGEMVAAVMDNAPPVFALAGHSMGGWVALEVVKRYPERVTKLCLANTTAAPDSIEKANARRDMMELVNSGHFDLVLARLLVNFIYQTKCLPAVKAMMMRNQDAFINQETAMLGRDTCVPYLANIRCPTLVIHAEQDKVFMLSDMQQLAENIPNAGLAIVPDSGHMSIMEQAPAVTALMREWLQDNQ